MLKCILVDDEQFSIDALLKYIGLMPDLQVNGIYTNPLQALRELSSAESTDLIFMDIDMPGISGLELAQALRAKTQKLVFTTAHSKYAFEAYEAEGDAFLLKPFSFAKFSTTVNRLFPVKSITDQLTPMTEDYFMVKSKEDSLAIVKIKFNEVIAFESAQNYIKIHQADGKVVIAYLTLKDIQQLVKHRPEFMQLHRAFIISTDSIDQIKGYTLRMNNGLQFSVGEIFRDQFSAYLDSKLMVTSRRH